MPSFKNMISFLEQRALIENNQSFQRQGSAQKQFQSQRQSQSSKNHSAKGYFKQTQACNKATITFNSKTTQNTCPICSEQHLLISCTTFQSMSPRERYNEIKKTSLCHNCLKGNHRTIDCRASTCEKCQRRHNILLHFEKEVLDTSNSATSTPVTTLASFQARTTSQIILGTAIVDILNIKGEYQSCRALLDSCSQCNSITEKLTNS